DITLHTGKHITAAIFDALLIFFFDYAGHHIHLHSFPTRRSSDLWPERSRSTCSAPVVTNALREADCCLGSTWAAVRFAERVRNEDRKSTRLNSSHVATSYAVFCLKKKTRSARPRASPARSPHTSA